MTATFLYDGDCAFCTTSARFMQRWIPTTAEVLPWQHADLPALGVTADEGADAVQWVGPHGERASGAAAIAAALRTSRWWWRVAGRVLGSRPVLPLAERVYRWVAANRYRLPGGTPACALPRP